VDLDTILSGMDGDDSAKAPRRSPPAMYAHIDNGPEWAEALFCKILGSEEADRLRQRGCRWAIINAWRPIKPVTRNPLGVVDTATVAAEDLVPVYAHLTPTWGNPAQKDLYDHAAQVYNVKANPAHKWYFASKMQADEVLLITIFDTQRTAGGHERRVVHSAFPYSSGSTVAPRESIEFRSLVVWDT
jgi:hypothetical protein